MPRILTQHIITKHGRVAIAASVYRSIIPSRVWQEFCNLSLPVCWKSLIPVRTNIVKALIVIALNHAAFQVEVEVYTKLHSRCTVQYRVDRFHLTDWQLLIYPVRNTAKTVCLENIRDFSVAIPDDVSNGVVLIASINVSWQVLCVHPIASIRVSGEVKHPIYC